MSGQTTNQTRPSSPEQSPICTTSTSSIYTMLPSAVRSRIPILASLRQSAGNVVSRPLLHARSWSAEECLSPPQPGNESRRTSISSTNAIDPAISLTSTPRSNSPDVTHKALIASPKHELSATAWESQGGIDWMTADTGVRLWLSARGQAESTTRNPALLRSMHIDAIKYMIMSLPHDLSHSEIETLQSSLPTLMLGTKDSSHPTVLASKPSVLRKGIAQAVCWTVAIILFVVPLMMTLLDRLIAYEREHHVTRRVLANGAEVTKVLRARGIDYGEAVLRYKDTPMVRAYFQAMSWTIESVVGGLNDGILQSAHDRALSSPVTDRDVTQ